MTFRAKVVDSLTGDPVPGVRLWHWQHPGVEGRSAKDGFAVVPDLMPGQFKFQVDAPGYARWWSDQAVQRVEPPQDRPDSWRLAAELRQHRFRP